MHHMTNPQWTLWAHCQCTSYHVRDLEWPWGSPTSLHTPDVSLFSHMFMTVKAILWDYVHHMRDPIIELWARCEFTSYHERLWVIWRVITSVLSLVIIRVMGKCFVMNHAGQFQCSKGRMNVLSSKTQRLSLFHCQELLRVHEHL